LGDKIVAVKIITLALMALNNEPAEQAYGIWYLER
jgi:hypothetical protein